MVALPGRDDERGRAQAVTWRRSASGWRACCCAAPFSGHPRLAGMCRELYDHRAWLWTFLERGDRADEQRQRAGAAACGDLAEAVVRHAERRRQPVRGDDADGDRDLPAAVARTCSPTSPRPSKPTSHSSRRLPYSPRCDRLQSPDQATFLAYALMQYSGHERNRTWPRSLPGRGLGDDGPGRVGE